VDHPRIIGRYALYDELAAGGMATVHLGRLMGPVGFSRTVAIKRLHPQYAKDPEFVAMFLDEARLAARIRHPNVAQTLDVVAVEGELFLVMDYISGEPLSRLRTLTDQSGRRIPPRIVTSILCGALHGLHAAHEATSDRGESLGIVHRDVSPQNILVGIDGIARVLDFGVAKATGRVHTTRDGRLKGKLAYMAPEQLQGKATRRTDLFAAAVVLWEALAGKRLFAGEDEQEIVGKVLSTAIAPPSTYLRDAGDVHASPEQLRLLDDVTLRGLARASGDRFETAREMALALERCFGIASPAEVGLWVESLAGPGLAERAQRVAEVESHSSVADRPMNDPALTPPQSVSSHESDAARPRVAEEDLTRSQLSNVSVSSALVPTIGSVRNRPRVWAAVTVLVTLLLVGSAGLVALRKAPNRNPPTLESARAEALPPWPPPVSSSSGEAAASVAPALDSPAFALVNDAGAPTPSPPRAAHPVQRTSPVNKAVVSGGQAKVSSPACDPPFTLDQDGHKHFKPECYLKKP
jgi:eukaryotic-like serine/threonine-protein kinase